MNKINIDQVKAMFNSRITEIDDIQYTRIICTTRLYSNMARHKDTIKFSDILGTAIYTYYVDDMYSCRYKKFYKIRY